jgi:dihydroflavonol-4-reductase
MPLIGRKHVFSSAKAKPVLSWTQRPAKETILDAARSALDFNLV